MAQKEKTIMKKILRIISEFIVGGILGILLGFIFLVIGSMLTANLPSDIEFAGNAGYQLGGNIGLLLGFALGSFLGVWLLERKDRACFPQKILFCTFGGVLGVLILLKLFADVFQFYNGGLIVFTVPIICAVLGAHQENKSRLYILAIVGIVAVVGIVILLLNLKSTTPECEAIESELEKDACYRTTAKNSGDKQWCETIIDDMIKESCYMDIALTWKDYTVCKKIKNSFIAESCQNLKESEE